MRFWDSSALVPLFVAETASPSMHALVGVDPEIVAWWATQVECISAIAQREREGAADPASVEQALGRLDELANAWHEIEPSEQVRRTARRVLRVHPLRTADALQVAAAIVAAEGRPSSLELVTLDDRLADAARREGFVVTPAAADGASDASGQHAARSADADTPAPARSRATASRSAGAVSAP